MSDDSPENMVRCSQCDGDIEFKPNPLIEKFDRIFRENR